MNSYKWYDASINVCRFDCCWSDAPQVVIDCLADAPRGNLVQALTARLDRLLELPLADDLTIVSTTRMTPPGATATPSAGQRGAG